MRQLQLQQNATDTFVESILGGDLTRPEGEIREEIESKWKKADKQNMNFAISIIGYDPFDNCGMTDNDRKYCFNILAGYCDSEGIQEDGHKIQSVIQIAQSHLQCKKIDEIINEQLLTVAPDDTKIKSLTQTKKQLLDSITSIARDNNLSSAYNKHSAKGANTLSAKMKEMSEAGYEPIKVNLFDIKTCSAIKQIADISDQAILDQITLDANDYTQMIAEQRDIIKKLRTERDEFEEENRMLKNKLVDMEQKKKVR